MRLVAAYEWLGHECGLEGRSAEAAAACAGACAVHAAFMGDEAQRAEASLGTSSSGSDFAGALSICPKRDLVASVLHWQHVGRAKTVAWAKRCGSKEALASAMGCLPVPPAAGLCTSGRASAIVTALLPQRAAVRQLLDCPVCYRLLHEPTTTPCGHTFCHSCLARILDAGSGCAMCRGKLSGSIGCYAPCRALQHVIESLFPEEYAQRHDDRTAELREARVDEEDCLPVISPGAFVVPGQHCSIRVDAPHNRLMLRRVLESGRRCIGTVAAVGSVGASLGYAKFGTELRICDMRMQSDGSAIVGCLGLQPFRILNRRKVDGYSVVSLERLGDEVGDEYRDVTAVALEELLKQASKIQSTMGIRFAVNGLVPGTLPKADDAVACDTFAWAVLSQVGAPITWKQRILGLRSRATRYAALAGKLRELLSGTEALPDVFAARALRRGVGSPWHGARPSPAAVEGGA